jgi:hypothetical protein
MADLTLQEFDLAGLTPSFSAADVAGDSFVNNGKTLLYVKNGDASSHDVTLNIQKTITIGGIDITLSNPTVTVPASDEKIIGPFSQDWFNDADGNVSVDYDAVTSVTVAALKL